MAMEAATAEAATAEATAEEAREADREAEKEVVVTEAVDSVVVDWDWAANSVAELVAGSVEAEADPTDVVDPEEEVMGVVEKEAGREVVG